MQFLDFADDGAPGTDKLRSSGITMKRPHGKRTYGRTQRVRDQIYAGNRLAKKRIMLLNTGATRNVENAALQGLATTTTTRPAQRDEKATKASQQEDKRSRYRLDFLPANEAAAAAPAVIEEEDASDEQDAAPSGTQCRRRLSLSALLKQIKIPRQKSETRTLRRVKRKVDRGRLAVDPELIATEAATNLSFVSCPLVQFKANSRSMLECLLHLAQDCFSESGYRVCRWQTRCPLLNVLV
jgi:hypothetical protein